MSQDFGKEYFIGKDISRAIFLGLIAFVLIGSLLVFIKIIIPPPYRDFIFGLVGILFFSMISIPGITIWKYPRFAQGWFSTFNSFFASAPWDKLNSFKKTLLYAMSCWGLFLGSIIFAYVVGLLFVSFCEFMKGVFSTLYCG